MAIAPYAVQAATSRGRLASGAGGTGAEPVAAGPGPDHPQQRLPQAAVQDAGLRQPRGRLLPHAADAQHRGGAGGAVGGARAGAGRGPDGGAGAGARPRAPPVRARRRGCAAGVQQALGRLQPQRAEPADRHPAREPVCGVRRAEPDLGDARGAGQAQRAIAAPAGLYRGLRQAAPPGAAHACVGRGAGGGHGGRHRLPQPRPGRRHARRIVRAGGHRAPARGGSGAGPGAAGVAGRAAAPAPA